MKKIFVFLSGFIFTGFSCFSQSGTTIFHEDFELPNPGDSVTASINIGSGTSWGICTSLHSQGLRSDTCQVKTGKTCYLTTNTFSTLGNTNVILNFSQICKTDFGDKAQVQVSNDGGTTWTLLTGIYYLGTGAYSQNGNSFSSNSYGTLWAPATASAIPNNTWWKNEAFDCSAFLSNCANAKIRFMLKDIGVPGPNGNFGWCLDNINVVMAPAETTPPLITLVSPYPQGLTYKLGPFPVRALCTDASGIDTAYIYYTVNSGPLLSVGLHHTSGDTMTAYIPAVTDSATVCWYIWAADASLMHNTARNPVSSCISFLARDCVHFPYCENFDNPPGPNKWTTVVQNNGSDWQLGTPAFGVTTGAHSPPDAWDINLNSASGANANNILTSPVFDFSQAVNARLSFWVNYSTMPMFDGTWMEYSTNGTSWTTLGSTGDPLGENWYNDINLGGQMSDPVPVWSDDSYGWIQCKYKLSLLNNVPAPVRFRFVFTSGNYAGMDGFSLDDFCITLPASQDASCTRVIGPVSGCGLGYDTVRIKIANPGASPITGANSSCYASYRIKDNSTGLWSTVNTEAVTSTIAADDSITFVFQNPAFLPATISDIAYTIKAWVTLAGDTSHAGDTAYRVITSKFLPPAPAVTNAIVPYAGSVNLAALTNAGNSLSWSLSCPGNTVASGASFQTPLIYAHQVFYVRATHTANGCTGPCAGDTVDLTGTPAYDMSVTHLLSPVSGFNLNQQVPVIICVRNFGSLPVEDYSLHYSGGLNGTADIHINPLTNPLPVLAGDSILYTFQVPANLSSYQSYQFKAWVDGVPGDNFYLNDSIKEVIENSHYSYCISAATYADRSDIGNFSLSNLNNGTAFPVEFNIDANARYSDFTQSLPPIMLIRGQSFPCSVSITSSLFGISSPWSKVYCDWNWDGSFDPVSELAMSGSLSNTGNILSGTVTVPANAHLGYTRLRVTLQEDASAATITPCNSYFYGETEDYSVIILPQIPNDAGVTQINSPLANYPEYQHIIPVLAVKNWGTLTIPVGGLTCGYKIDNGPAVILSGVNANAISPGTASTVNLLTPVTFPAGTHIFKAWTTLAGDTNLMNDTARISIFGVPVDTLPYTDNFDGSIQKFQANNSTETKWIHGIPVLWPPSSISSPDAWATNMNIYNGYYGYDAKSYLTTQVFDFTNVTGAWLDFWLISRSQPLADGTHMEYSTDAGNTWFTLPSLSSSQCSNWYNAIINSPAYNGPAWSGLDNNWTHVRYELNAFNYQPAVRFRFVFNSGPTTCYMGGTAIDNFKIRFPFQKDAALEAVLQPSSTLITGSQVNPMVILSNTGIDSLVMIPGFYQVNNNVPVAFTWTSASALLTDSTVNFTIPLPMTVPHGPYTLKVWTDLQNDGNHSNDTIVVHLEGWYPCQSNVAALDTNSTVPAPAVGMYLHVCQSDTISFSGRGIYNSNNTSYLQSDNTSSFYWDFGDGTQGTGKLANHHYSNPGGYRVYLKVRDQNWCYSPSMEVARVNVAGEIIAGLHLHQAYCPGEPLHLTTGYSLADALELRPQFCSMYSAEPFTVDTIAFLPDFGISGGGCTDIPLNITTSDPTATITSSQQLLSVNLNMEHSYAGDLQIELHCPNGQHTDLKTFIHQPNGSLGVSYGSDNPQMYDCNSPSSCALDPSMNPAGQGWTYSWKMISAEHGLMNNYFDHPLDSGSYLPDSGFQHLVGCPVNGTWFLRICDYWAIDNGWLFWWSLQMADSLQPLLWSYQVPLDTILWSGPDIITANNHELVVQPDSGGIHSYYADVTDAYGCHHDTVLHINVYNPVEINCGPGQSYLGSTSSTLSCQVIQGVPPFTYIWSTGEQADTAFVTTTVTTTYYITVTDAHGCIAVDSVTVIIGSCPSIGGSVQYRNGPATPLIGVTTRLYRNSILIADTVTDSQGNYTFPGICQSGDYTIGVTCNIPFGGINAVDALFSMRYFVGMMSLSNIQRQAADVNGSGYVNSADALEIMRRFVGITSSFAAGNWSFDNGEVGFIPGQISHKVIKALCTGDIDGSYIPGARIMPSISLQTLAEIKTISMGQEIELPVYADPSSSYHALSLIMKFDPNNIDIEKIIPVALMDDADQTGFLANITRGEIRLAWFSLNPVDIDKTIPLFLVRMKLLNNILPQFEVSGNSAFANLDGQTVSKADLWIPTMVLDENEPNLSAFPNPADDHLEIHYSIPVAGSVKLSLCNPLGQEIAYYTFTDLHAGEYVQNIPVKDFPAGVFTLKLEVKTSSYDKVKILKIIKF